MTAELSEQLKFAGCTSPLPLECPICKHGNGGIGFDYCYLRHLIKEAVAEDREMLVKIADARAKQYTGKDDKWGAGYTCAMQQFAAAIRQVKP